MVEKNLWTDSNSSKHSLIMYVRQCAKHSICIVSLNAHNNLVNKYCNVSILQKKKQVYRSKSALCKTKLPLLVVLILSKSLNTYYISITSLKILHTLTHLILSVSNNIILIL